MTINRANCLEITASGGCRFFTSEQNEVQISPAKGAAIIAYLMFSESPHATRDKLASLLWSESSNTAARTALRQCLHQLKNRLSNIQLDILDVGPETISLNRDAVVTDLDFIDPAADSHNVLNLSGLPDTSRLLEGFDHLDEAYSEWLRDWRDGIGSKIRSGLAHQIKSAGVSHDLRLEAAESLNRIDPADEVAARYLIQEQARNNNLAEILRIYKRQWNALDEELGEEPSMDLQNFVAGIRLKLGDPTSDGDLAGTTSIEKSAAKRRSFVTVLAVRMQHIKPSRLTDIEEVEDLLKPYNAIVEDVVRKFGGTLSKKSGNEVIGIFGHPNTSEEDAHNALKAALELKTQVESKSSSGAQNLKVSSGIGLDSGLVFIRHAEDENGPGDLLGAPVDLALELARKNDAQSVLATERSIRRLTSEFATSAEDPLPNGEVPEAIVSVHSRQPNRSIVDFNAQATAKNFIGRVPFLTKLDEAWSETLQDGLQLVSVVGDPGIGKTRLVSEFLREKNQSIQATCLLRCNRNDRIAPLEPIHALNSWIQSIEPLSANEIGEHSSLTDGQDEAESFQSGDDHNAESLTDRLTRSLSQERTILAFDDWQWADDATRKVLRTLIQRLRAHRILVILIARDTMPDEQVLPNAKKVILSALTEVEVSQVASRILGWEPESVLKKYLCDKSGGNPLYLEEICHAYAHHNPESQDQEITHRLPASLQGLIISRLERQSDPLRRIIEAAAVNGDSVSVSLLETVLGESLDDNTLMQLSETELLLPTQQNRMLRFQHGITQDVVYGTIDLGTRRNYHSAFANALEADAKLGHVSSIIEELALHYRGAGNYERAAFYAERAGDKAISASSLDLAKNQYAAAIELIDQCEPSEENQRNWLSVAMRWGIPCVYAPSREQIPVLERAARMAEEFDDITSMSAVNHWIGFIMHVLGDHADSIKKLTLAMKQAMEADNLKVLAEASATRGFTYAARCDYARAQEDIEFAIAAKDRHPGTGTSVPVLSSYARAILAVIKADQGDFSAGSDLIGEALRRVEGFDHEIESSICNMNCAMLLWQGRWSEAEAISVRSRKRSEIVNSPYLIGMARCLYGYANWRHSNNSEAVDFLCVEVERLWSTEMRLYISFGYGWISDACFGIGRYDEAFQAATKTITLAEGGDPVGAAMACRTLAALAAASGEEGKQKSLEHLEKAEFFARRRNSPHEHAVNLLHGARLHASLGERDIAGTLAANSKRLFAELGMTWHQERANALEGKLLATDLKPDRSLITQFAL